MSYYFVVSILFTRDSWKIQSSRTSSISTFHQNSLHPSPQVHSIPLDPVVSTTIGCGIPLLSRRSGSESQCIGSISSSRIKSITLTPSRRYLEGFICGSGCPSCVSSNGPALGQPWVNLTSNLSGNPLRPPTLTSTLLNQLGNLRHPPSIPPPVKLQTSTSKVFKSRNFYVGSPTLIWVLPSSSDEEKDV
ncbi:hypothetical protein Rs2_32998 [Raphanus sativus]|nr:hypothetical protein Rs2_32998 [Raphanus sativus]